MVMYQPPVEETLASCEVISLGNDVTGDGGGSSVSFWFRSNGHSTGWLSSAAESAAAETATTSTTATRVVDATNRNKMLSPGTELNSMMPAVPDLLSSVSETNSMAVPDLLSPGLDSPMASPKHGLSFPYLESRVEGGGVAAVVTAEKWRGLKQDTVAMSVVPESVPAVNSNYSLHGYMQQHDGCADKVDAIRFFSGEMAGYLAAYQQKAQTGLTLSFRLATAAVPSSGSAATAGVQLWSAFVCGGTLFVKVPPVSTLGNQKMGFKECIVSIMDLAESILHCANIVFCLEKHRIDLSFLLRSFLFVGFEVVDSSNEKFVMVGQALM